MSTDSGKLFRLIAPNGEPIIGTFEQLNATAYVQGFTRTKKGWEPEYEGDTDMDWDSQEPIRRRGKLVVVDADGNTWSEKECRWEEITDE